MPEPGEQLTEGALFPPSLPQLPSPQHLHQCDPERQLQQGPVQAEDLLLRQQFYSLPALQAASVYGEPQELMQDSKCWLLPHSSWGGGAEVGVGAGLTLLVW